MIVIDGTSYNVPFVSLTRTADPLDKYAERVENGTLNRELIGVFFNYKMTFGAPTSSTELTAYQALWEKITEATEFHTVTLPDELGDYSFEAYFAGMGDELRRTKNGKNFWKGLTCNMIARSPALTP
jgi:hypothetical protein